MKFLIAAVAFILSALLVLSLHSLASGGGLLIRTNVAFSAFTVSVWPAFAAVIVGLALVEKVTGVSPGPLMAGALALLAGFGLLTAYIFIAYDFRPVFSETVRDWPLALAFAVGGVAYAATRKRLG
ncbi:MAG: hypothetical protein AAGD92_01430 [Pseudomonadota bacterium]